MQLRRVVVGVDFSAASRSVAQWASQVFAADSTVVLVHVLEAPRRSFFRWPRREEPLPSGPPAEQPEPPATSVSGATDRLQQLSKQLGEVPAETRVIDARPTGRSAADRIIAAAEKSDANLIVVARSNQSSFSPFMGSTAETLVQRSSLPVVVAQDPGSQPIHRILAPVDESLLTERVIETARAHAERLGARLTLFQVTDTVRYGPVFPISLDPQEHSAEDALRRETLERLTRLLDRLGVPRDEVDLQVATGDPAQKITEAARLAEAGLIVMGNRGAGLIERTLLGSVASTVLNTAPCPVLVVTQPDRP